MTILVFDIETVPDIKTSKRLFDLHDLSDTDVREYMLNKRLQETQGRSDFLEHYLHRIVAISVVLKRHDSFSVWSLGDVESEEAELLQRFFEGIERYSPTMVSWNGGGFDLPVIHYRSLLHNISGKHYWESGDNERDFRWNNYLNRYHNRHTDLMDVIASYQSRAWVALDKAATFLGFPGKMGMSGDKVWDCYCNQDIESIRHYCETDVLNTYLIYLRYQLICGNLSTQDFESDCLQVKTFLQREAKPHLLEFLESWETI